MEGIDWSEVGKDAVIDALGAVPEIGSVLSFLTDHLWPTDDPDVWDQIREQVQQLIGQMLSEDRIQQLKEALDGLKMALEDYKNEIADPTPATLQTAKTKWLALEEIFMADYFFFAPNPPKDNEPDYRVLLLPQFAQFATLYIGLLRDGVIAGSSWWSAEDLEKRQVDLTAAISKAVAYTRDTYKLGLVAKQQTPADNHRCEPFRTVNAYVREMTLGALDYITIWPYMDPQVEHDSPKPVLIREIYSDPFGTADDSGPIGLPWANGAPTNAIDRVKVYGGGRIASVEVMYYDNGGPGGETTTGQMGIGGMSYNALTPPNGGTAWIGPNKIVSVDVSAGDALEGLTIHTSDGGSSTYGRGGGTSLSYSDHIVSSLFVNGVSNFYGGADTLVVGFMHKDALPDPPPNG